MWYGPYALALSPVAGCRRGNWLRRLLQLSRAAPPLRCHIALRVALLWLPVCGNAKTNANVVFRTGFSDLCESCLWLRVTP